MFLSVTREINATEERKYARHQWRIMHDEEIAKQYFKEVIGRKSSSLGTWEGMEHSRDVIPEKNICTTRIIDRFIINLYIFIKKKEDTYRHRIETLGYRIQLVTRGSILGTIHHS